MGSEFTAQLPVSVGPPALRGEDWILEGGARGDARRRHGADEGREAIAPRIDSQ
jgi:hypothetical protein